jgi:aminoglycoside phosphotransferase (APT) family kinase protein
MRAVSDELVHAVLPPPDLWKFRDITGVGDSELDVSFDGGSKLAILAEDRVFLFPRRGHDEAMLHGALACECLAGLGLDCVPRMLGRWPEGVLAAGPFVAYERRSGTSWSELEDTVGLAGFERMLTSLGRLIASWHRLDISRLPVDLRRPLAQDRHWLSRFLDTDRVERTVDEVVRLLDAKPAWAKRWRQTALRLASLPPVLLHGDCHANQLLVDDHLHVCTVIDWDASGLGNPLMDFDFGEWGAAIFSWEAEFATLRQAMWTAYTTHLDGALGTDPPTAREVHLLFTLKELAYFEESNATGPIDDFGAARLAKLRQQIGSATETVDG